jgi:FlgN protein
VETLLNELKALLSEEVALHEGLRSDLAYESEQDGQLPSADFLRLQQRKYYWVNQIEGIETRRIEHVRQLAEQWRVDPRKLTLREIIARSSSPLSEELQGYHGALTALVEAIRTLARETSANAQARLKAIEATLTVIGEAVKMHPTYSEAGRLQKRTPTFKHTSA